jgi:hypothetical protein
MDHLYLSQELYLRAKDQQRLTRGREADPSQIFLATGVASPVEHDAVGVMPLTAADFSRICSKLSEASPPSLVKEGRASEEIGRVLRALDPGRVPKLSGSNGWSEAKTLPSGAPL